MSIATYQALTETARPTPGIAPGPPAQYDTLVKVAHWRAQAQPDDCAFVFLVDGEEQEERISYAQLDRRARAIAAELQARGAAGRRVLLVFDPGLEYNAALFGCLYAGAVAVPVYPPDPFRAQRTLPRLQSILQDAQADFVLSSEAILEFSRPGLRAVRSAEVIALEDISESAAARWSLAGADPQQVALLQYTSGSTGTPRGVILTHANLMHNLAALHRLDRENAVGVTWLPPYHDMGLIGTVMLPVHSGRPLVMLSPLSFMQRPVRWLLAVTRYRGTTTGSPNFGYELCVRKVAPQERRQLDLSSWTVTVNGSEPIRAGTIDRFVEAFGPCGFRREAFYPAFGMAESTLLVSGAHPDDAPLLAAFSEPALRRNRVRPVSPDEPGARRMVGCGQPIPDGEIVIVNPRTRRPMPQARVGEIWVRSPSVGLGYWNRPEESRRMFEARLAADGEYAHELLSEELLSHEDPGDHLPGDVADTRKTYLRTGDLGFIHEGELFIAGRLKELIILAGRNYYPHDIERTVERAHPALKPDGGAAFGAEIGGEERLVVVHEVARPKRYDLNEVLRAIQAELAQQYELSAFAVLLIPTGSLPKTSSGKTRRRHCCEMFLRGEFRALAQWRADEACAGPDSRSEPPQGEVERRLGRLWSEVLGIAAVGRQDDFFALGGQSLRAVQLAGRIQTEFGVEVPLERLFAGPTLAEMGAEIERLAAEAPLPGAPGTPDAPAPCARRRPIPRRKAEAPAALSFAEQRLWFFDQLQPGHPFYNLPAAARLRGALDLDVLRRSLHNLVARHESLRTTYPAGQGLARRQVHPPGDTPFEVVDLRPVDGARREVELQRLLRDEASRSFNLAEGPLFRCVVYRLADEEHVVLFSVHHIVVDGWSLGVMVEELGALYQAALEGRKAELPRLEIQYADFAAWQLEHVEAEVLQRELDYWQRVFQDEPPVLQLPYDHPRPPVQTFRGALRPFCLPAGLAQRLQELAREQRTTLFTVLLTALKAMLSRHCRQQDVTVGTVVANRTRPELERLVGFFANTLALRTDLSGDPSFRDLLGRVSRVVIEAFAHQELPFDKLVERLDPRRYRNQAPLFQTALVLENMPLRLPGGPGAQPKPLLIDNGTAKYDLALLVTETDERIAGYAEYSTDLFEPATIDRLLGSFATLLQAALRDPDTPVSRLPLLDAPSRAQVLRLSRTRRMASVDSPSLSARARSRAGAERGQEAVSAEPLAPAEPPAPCLHQLFEAQARQRPHAIAVVADGRPVTYAELDERANRLAWRLRRLGLDPEAPITVCLPRSLDQVTAMLAVLKAGGAYLPIDPNQPEGRIRFLLEDSGTRVLITLRALGERFAKWLPDDGAGLVLVDEPAEMPLDQGSGPPPVQVSDEQLAYVIYTSGSTGRPKGVLIEHRGIVSFVRSFSRRLEIDARSRVLSFFSPGSDGSISDAFSALANGATLVVAPPDVLRSPGGLQELVRRQQVTAATLTPSMLALLEPDDLAELRTICAVGEALSPELAARWAGAVRLINGYGVSEAACGACLMDVDGATTGRVPIGRPLDGVDLYVLDEHLEPVPLGVPGEICIGGVQVGREYLNRPELTARCFVPDRFSPQPGARLYRTGDLGRLRADGIFEYLGRMDDQVNVRGHRVEPGEVAAVLEAHPLVAQAAVVAREDRAGQLQLVAYVVAHVHGRTAASTEEEADTAAERAARASLEKGNGRKPSDAASALEEDEQAPGADVASTRGRTVPASAGAAGENENEQDDLEALRREIPELRRYLRARLPDYMVPSAFVPMSRLPRTVQGKLDRRALPAPADDRRQRGADFLAPRNADQRLVAEIWEKLLGTNPIGVRDDFFELGGHSMLAVEVMAAIEQRTGRRLPLAALFQEPTVEHLARLVSRAEIAAPAGCLVTLQAQGTGRPIFCIHPAGGTVFCYRELARLLGTDRPFFGLQAVGVDGLSPPQESVGDMVAHYVAAIRSRQPHGPYLIGGWSLGGNLAFETARVLAEEGEEIGLLAIFDAGALHADREPGPDDFLPMVMELFPDDENLPLDVLREMAPRQQLEYFVERAGQARVVLAQTDFQAARYVFEVFKSSMKAMLDYRQKPYPGKVTLFAAESRGKLFHSGDDPLLGWGRWARGGVEVHRIPGRHIHMVQEPNVRALAARLRECLERVENEQDGL